MRDLVPETDQLLIRPGSTERNTSQVMLDIPSSSRPAILEKMPRRQMRRSGRPRYLAMGRRRMRAIVLMTYLTPKK